MRGILERKKFRLQIWNENKILRILVPILTYFNTNYFFQNTVQIFFSQVGQYGYLPKNAEFYAYSKSEDEICDAFFLILPSDLESV